MRFGIKHLIESLSSNITLENVDFYNIHTCSYTIKISGIIDNNFFIYQEGVVELLNNGFEAIGTIDLNPFMQIQTLENVIIEDVSFSYNLVNADNGNLIFIADVYRLKLNRLELVSNYVDNYLVNVYQNVDMPKGNDGWYYFYDNIQIINCIFKRNYMKKVLSLNYLQNCQNINIEFNNFEENIAQDSILELSFINDYPNECSSQQEWDDLTIPAIHTNINSNSFTKNYALYNVAKITSFGNVNLISNTLSENGSTLDPNSITGSDISQAQNSYLKLGLPSFQQNLCQTLLITNELSSLTIQSLEFEYNLCPLLSISSITTSLSINTISISHNSLSSDDWFFYLNSKFCNMQQLAFSDNTYSITPKGLIFIQGVLEAQSCTLDSIYISQSPNSIKTKKIANLAINDLTVIESNSDLYSGVYFFVSSNSVLSISQSTFESNTKGILHLVSESAGLSLLLSIDSVTLSELTTQLAIYIDPTLEINEKSSINSIYMLNSQAKFLTLSSIKGKLLLNDCFFNENTLDSDNLIEVSGNNILIIQNTIFEKTTADSVIYGHNSDGDTFLSIKDSKFIKNIGSSVKISSATAEIINSDFLYNQAGYGPVVYITEGSELAIIQCTLVSNTALINGVIYITLSSYLKAEDTTFMTNYAYLKGGGIYADQKSIIDVKNSVFIENTAYQGSCIFAQNLNPESIIDFCLFVNNSAEFTGCVSLHESELTITNSAFDNNNADHYPALEAIYFTDLKLINSSFKNHLGEGAHLGIEGKSSIKASYSIFKSSASIICCSIFKVLNSYFSCAFCRISDSFSYSSSAISCEKS